MPFGLRRLPLEKPERFSVGEVRLISLAKGDRIQLTKNLRKRSRLVAANRSIFTVESLDIDGTIHTTEGKTIPGDFAHLKHGYVSTSYSSQGKTVDSVIVLQSDLSRPATNTEQFYVSCSRARNRIKVITDSIEILRESVLESGQRISASELSALLDDGEEELIPEKVEKVRPEDLNEEVSIYKNPLPIPEDGPQRKSPNTKSKNPEPPSPAIDR